MLESVDLELCQMVKMVVKVNGDVRWQPESRVLELRPWCQNHMLDRTVYVWATESHESLKSERSYLVLCDSIAESVGLEYVLASFDFEVRGLLRHSKQISFLNYTLEIRSWQNLNMDRSYSAANTAVASRGLLDRCKCNGELEGATVAVAIISLLFFSFCHLRTHCFWERATEVIYNTSTIAGFSACILYSQCLRQVRSWR